VRVGVEHAGQHDLGEHGGQQLAGQGLAVEATLVQGRRGRADRCAFQQLHDQHPLAAQGLVGAGIRTVPSADAATPAMLAASMRKSSSSRTRRRTRRPARGPRSSAPSGCEPPGSGPGGP
jgi:hypothetical protein